MTATHQGSRFAFGRNWRRFLDLVDDERVAMAERSLAGMLEVADLEAKSFLDAGSGSGLFSLAARRLGARVHSFDSDPQSVACTLELKRRYCPNDGEWEIDEGSVLDDAYLSSMGAFDIVYSWGVLHHTGAMWKALGLIERAVAPGGVLYVSIYNDQGGASRRWAWVKRTYNELPKGLKFLILWPAFLRVWAPTFVRDFLVGRPFYSWRNYGSVRGMSPWRDLVDWVGGYPFEVARPEEIFEFYRDRGFRLRRLRTCGGGHGCNEFVFERAVR